MVQYMDKYCFDTRMLFFFHFLICPLLPKDMLLILKGKIVKSTLYGSLENMDLSHSTVTENTLK